jgi:hypothetical protein
MFSWGNLPFPQTPMDAIFFEKMSRHPISKPPPRFTFFQKKQLKFLPFPIALSQIRCPKLPFDFYSDKQKPS